MQIWSAWFQGRQNAPDFVRSNFNLWERLNPEDTLHVVEQKEAEDILAKMGILQPRVSPQIMSDLVRCYLLKEHGGVWADSTLLPTVPLSDWLTPAMRSEGFFAFRSLGDPSLVLQSWFIYAEKGNPLMAAWQEAFAAYFKTVRRFPNWKRALYHLAVLDFIRYKRAVARQDMRWFVDPARGYDCVFYPYSVIYYCFAQLLQDRPDLRLTWDRVPHRTAHLPEQIGQASRDPDTAPGDFLAAVPELLRVSPVHKLNHHNPVFVKLVEMVEKGMQPR